MSKEDCPALTGDAQTDDLLRRETARRASASGAGGSHPALEATLASISAEVTAEAVERLHREAKAKRPTGRAGTCNERNTAMAFTMSYGIAPPPVPTETPPKATAPKKPAPHCGRGHGDLRAQAQAVFDPAPASAAAPPGKPEATAGG